MPTISSEDLLKQLRKLPENKICAICRAPNSFGHQNVCVDFNSFVCDTCKSAHQSFSHLCKHVHNSTFTDEEVQSLQPANGGSNNNFNRIWLGNPKAEKYRPKQGSTLQEVKDFVNKACEKKKFYVEGGNPDIPVSEIPKKKDKKSKSKPKTSKDDKGFDSFSGGATSFDDGGFNSSGGFGDDLFISNNNSAQFNTVNFPLFDGFDSTAGQSPSPSPQTPNNNANLFDDLLSSSSSSAGNFNQSKPSASIDIDNLFNSPSPSSNNKLNSNMSSSSGSVFDSMKIPPPTSTGSMGMGMPPMGAGMGGGMGMPPMGAGMGGGMGMPPMGGDPLDQLSSMNSYVQASQMMKKNTMRYGKVQPVNQQMQAMYMMNEFVSNSNQPQQQAPNQFGAKPNNNFSMSDLF